MPTDPQFWNELAERYAAKPVDDPAAFERKIDITRAMMSPDKDFVDVGCGTGSLALRLADAGRTVHGVDFSSEMLRIANEKARDVDNVQFHQGTIEQAPFAPGSLGGVGAFSILHLVEDRAAFLAKAREMLEDDGFFVSSTVVLGESWVPYSIVLKVMRWLGKAPPVWILTQAQLLEEIEAAGFVDVQAHDVGADTVVSFITARKAA